MTSCVKCIWNRHLMDFPLNLLRPCAQKAPDFRSGDCRFESWQSQFLIVERSHLCKCNHNCIIEPFKYQKGIDRDRTRTCNPQIRSLVPYPLGHTVSCIRWISPITSGFALYQNMLQQSACEDDLLHSQHMSFSVVDA